MNILKQLFALFKRPVDIPPDPRKHCSLLRDEGCTHVDGYLCDTRTCEEKIAYDKVLLLGRLNQVLNDKSN